MAADPRNALPEPPDDLRPRPPFYDPSGDEPAGSSDGLPNRSAAGASPHTHEDARGGDTPPAGHANDDPPTA